MKIKIISTLMLLSLILTMSGCGVSKSKQDINDSVNTEDITAESLLKRMHDMRVPDTYAFDYKWQYDVTVLAEDETEQDYDMSLTTQFTVDTADSCRLAMNKFDGTVGGEDMDSCITIYVDFDKKSIYTQTAADEEFSVIQSPNPIPRDDDRFYALVIPELYTEDIENLKFDKTDSEYKITGKVTPERMKSFIKYIGESSDDLFSSILATDCNIDVELTFDAEHALVKQIRMCAYCQAAGFLDQCLEFTWDIDLFATPDVSVPEEVRNNAKKAA